jgi:acetylornithine deacetylase/succinyl-diaminopimelate desuccinylase-like protein
LVRIPSVGPRNARPPFGAIDEGRIAAQEATWFEAFGGEVEREDVYPRRPNTCGIWRGLADRWIAVASTRRRRIERMIDDPFDGRLENGRVYGRGSVDTKASLGVGRPDIRHLVFPTVSFTRAPRMRRLNARHG